MSKIKGMLFFILVIVSVRWSLGLLDENFGVGTTVISEELRLKLVEDMESTVDIGPRRKEEEAIGLVGKGGL